MAFDSLKKLVKKWTGPKKADPKEVVGRSVAATKAAELPVVHQKVNTPVELPFEIRPVEAAMVAAQQVVNDDTDLLIKQVLGTLGTGMGPTSEMRSGLLAHVKRTLGSMGLPSWDRHEWETLRKVGHMAADLLSDVEYLRPWVEYYAVKLGYRSTETLVVLLAKHAVMDSFTAVIHTPKE